MGDRVGNTLAHVAGAGPALRALAAGTEDIGRATGSCPDGGVDFASKVGQLAGNHFITLTSNLDKLPELGRKTLWEGAQPILFEIDQ